MKRGVDVSFLCQPPFPVEPTPEAVGAAKAFAMRKWTERHEERTAEWERALGSRPSWPAPEDLSSSCKFTSVFAAAVFGGHVEGNHDHQYAVVGGRVLDLNEDAADVLALDEPYRHDPAFFGSRDHRASMESCYPRVRAWLGEFAELVAAPSRRP